MEVRRKKMFYRGWLTERWKEEVRCKKDDERERTEDDEIFICDRSDSRNNT